MSVLSLDMGLSDLSVSTSTPYFTVVLRKASAEISLAPASVPRARERIDHYPTCRGGGWYLLVFGISPSSQGKESAQFPGRFTESLSDRRITRCCRRRPYGYLIWSRRPMPHTEDDFLGAVNRPGFLGESAASPRCLGRPRHGRVPQEPVRHDDINHRHDSVACYSLLDGHLREVPRDPGHHHDQHSGP
jgi:hypothetical protein